MVNNDDGMNLLATRESNGVSLQSLSSSYSMQSGSVSVSNSPNRTNFLRIHLMNYSKQNEQHER